MEFEIIGDDGCSTCLGYGIVKITYPNGYYTGKKFICDCAIYSYESTKLKYIEHKVIYNAKRNKFLKIYNGETKMEQNKINIKKISYYYLRDWKNFPVVTICLGIDDDGNVAKGMSITSVEDTPNKKIGRDIAKKRMFHAMFSKENSEPIGSDKAYTALEILTDDSWRCFDDVGYKSIFAPADTAYKSKYMTEYECKLIGK